VLLVSLYLGAQESVGQSQTADGTVCVGRVNAGFESLQIRRGEEKKKGDNKEI
jgi:hypothetical protein